MTVLLPRSLYSVNFQIVCGKAAEIPLTNFTTPIAFHARNLGGKISTRGVEFTFVNPPVTPAFSIMVLCATTLTRSHSASLATLQPVVEAATASRASSSKAFWKHFEAPNGIPMR